MATWRTWLIGAAFAVLASGAVGCGGALMASDAGAGSGGAAGGGAAGAGGATQVYTWPGGGISVGGTSAVASNLIVIVEDQATPPALNAMLAFGPTTKWNPTDGAGVTALYTCGGPMNLIQVQLVSCSGQTGFDYMAAGPGCLVAVLTPDGTMGNFIHPGGAACNITASKTTIQMPPFDGVQSPDAAVGTFEFECVGADGTQLLLGGHFVLPAYSSQLAC